MNFEPAICAVGTSHGSRTSSRTSPVPPELRRSATARGAISSSSMNTSPGLGYILVAAIADQCLAGLTRHGCKIAQNNRFFATRLTGETSPMPSALEFARSQQARFLEELKSLLRIPSISTLPEHAGDVRRAAESLARELERIGLEHVRVIETSGHPLVYGDWLHAAGKPTCLAYGHYDVQPPDPLDEWLTPPFEPTERDNNLYARGAVDDKGQMFTHVKALESLFNAGGGALPINV